MKGSCLCGRITVEVPGRPDYLNQCNCSFCTKLGALWGYYPADAVAITGAPETFQRNDVARPKLHAHFCGTCGSTTHWSPIDPAERAERAVNMRLFDPAELRGVEVRYGDRRYGDADGPRRYARPPTVFGDAGAIA